MACSPDVVCKRVKKGKQSHKDDAAKVEENGLIPSTPLKSYQRQYKSGRVNGFVPVP